jgi:hypothetical protein
VPFEAPLVWGAFKVWMRLRPTWRMRSEIDRAELLGHAPAMGVRRQSMQRLGRIEFG